MDAAPNILIIDDDALHLKLYSLILERKGFATTSLLVDDPKFALPEDRKIDLVLLDYKYRSGITAPEIAKQIREKWPSLQIVVLSDVMWMPEDMTTLANAFVRKGDPEQLVEKIAELVPDLR
jgi:DNA-binding response OmpR family regulator